MLQAGSKLGDYEVKGPLGKGGMGEVYRARDTRLGRDVALKVLPEHVAKNADRRSRFEREAKLLASLNHPGIATLYGVEDDNDGVPVLVMELVEGETLADVIERQPIPLTEALPLFGQIADAVGAAHGKGIVHRDLKPANIQVTREGIIKVLDFGIAKAIAPEPTGDVLSQSPTLTRNATQEGVILGTAFYMSPEQARGRDVDKRTDVWAFGCVLYEALTGRKAFDGETASDVLGAILHKEPDWTALPASLPWEIRKLLQRCLEKEPRRRLHDIADARIEIEDVASGRSQPQESSKEPQARVGPMVAATVLSALVAGAVVWNFRTPESPEPIRLVLPLPEEQRIGGLTNSLFYNPVAISPDGQRIAYVAQAEDHEIYVRSLDQLVASPIAGTEGGTNPFLSPDGQWLGFFAGREIRKVRLDGGLPQVIADVGKEIFRGAAWGPDNTITFFSGTSGLRRVSSDGGPIEALTTPDPETGPIPHWLLQLLPGGREVLFLHGGAPAVLNVETGEWDLLDGLPDFAERRARGTSTRYLPTGHLVYLTRTGTGTGQLVAVPFDLSGRTSRGSPVPVIESMHIPQNFAFFAISANGTLVYVSAPSGEPAIVRVTRDGRSSPLVAGAVGVETHPRFSPDGVSIAIDFPGAEGPDTWIVDTTSGTKRRLTFGGDNVIPAWTPDGSRIAFANRHDLYWVPTDGSGTPEAILEGSVWYWPGDWSPDGQVLAFMDLQAETGFNIGLLPRDGGEPTPFAATRFNELGAKFSPDGAFIAYTSDESGRNEVYVRGYPDTSGKILVSTNGGAEPTWSPDGTELFYRRGRSMMAATIQTDPRLAAATPVVLFEGSYDMSPEGEQHYDVSPDGQSFALIQLQEIPALNVTINWFEELKQLVPTP